MENVIRGRQRFSIGFGLKEKLILLLIVSAISVVVGQSFEETVNKVTPEETEFHSVINKKQSGLSALLTITDQTGLPCSLWSLPYRKLSEVKGSLYIVQPATSWSASEQKEILSWVEKGNQLIYFDSFFKELNNWKEKRDEEETEQHKVKKIVKNKFLNQLGLTAEWIDNKAIFYHRELPEMAHVNKLLLNTQVKIIGGDPMVSCGDGAYITSVKHGAGRIIVGSVPELCANKMLGKTDNYDNFQFMINCFRANDGIVIFDEYCHGLTQHNNVFVYFSRRLPGLICFQLLFMLFAFELTSGQRFGAKKTYKNKRQISDLAYVSGLANVYKRAQANLVALEIIVGFWKAKLCRHLGLSARASAEEIVNRAKAYSDLSAASASVPSPQRALPRLDTHGSSPRSPRLLSPATTHRIQWVDDLQRFLNEYELTLSQGEVSKIRLTELIKQCDSLIQGMR